MFYECAGLVFREGDFEFCWVFMTIGPYQAMGSWMGLPAKSRKRTGSSMVVISSCIARAVDNEVAGVEETGTVELEVVDADLLEAERIAPRVEVGFAVDDVDQHGMVGRDRMMEPGLRRRHVTSR